jgi:diguanylate cyclase
MSAKSLAQTALIELCLSTDGRRLMMLLQPIIEPRIGELVKEFYRRLLANEQARSFFRRDEVNAHLESEMYSWVRSLFSVSSEKKLHEFVDRQLKIGSLHARLGIPLFLVVHAKRLLRQLLAETVQASPLSAEVKYRAVCLVGDVLDYWIVLMNQSFVSDAMRSEREAQSLRENVLGRDVAVECERARSELYNWARRVAADFCQSGRPGAPPLLETDFGLWLLYRAEFLIPDSNALTMLQVKARQLDELARDTVGPRSAGSSVDSFLHGLDEYVEELASGLAKLGEQSLIHDAGKDALTRLFNRRFVSVVLQRETQLARKLGNIFSVLLVDVDHFKALNDQQGHDVGDVVLRQIAELLLREVRASDFVFRYGGEEFLVILGNANDASAMAVAEGLRAAMEGAFFGHRHQGKIDVTASIGVAAYDGDPDVNRLIKRADEALYAAKAAGRNCCRQG